MCTFDFLSVFQIDSEITCDYMELRWQTDGVHCSHLLVVNGLLSLTARLTHLHQPQMQCINNVGALFPRGRPQIEWKSVCHLMRSASALPLQLNIQYTGTHTSWLMSIFGNTHLEMSLTHVACTNTRTQVLRHKKMWLSLSVTCVCFIMDVLIICQIPSSGNIELNNGTEQNGSVHYPSID